MLTLKKTLLTLFLFFSLGFALWVVLLNYRPPLLNTPTTALMPDGFMEEVYATIIDKEGNLKMKIYSPRMVHYADHDTTKLSQPRLIIYRQSPQPWYVTAKTALATEGAERIDFSDNVIIRHPGDAKQALTTIKTSTLTVFTSDEIAKTQDKITLYQPNVTVHAQGMFANMKQGEINLLSHVRGTYAPN
jgi:lipopolysaccharide export system protein LptC